MRTRCGPTTLHAESTLDTHFGSARSARKRDGDRILLEVTVPPGATAKVVGPWADESTTTAAIIGSARGTRSSRLPPRNCSPE
ncbi:alpha-L-rhamnosidase C-terminal domain-containing protein [Nocardia sp. NBC_01377]|uniref:alpha-L-rhamnosidase C-terminal domain-containing protein n=1 Tax=Nocardia sp. NBC_01377 TaxID=2903595 RepID=UPI0038658ED9